MDIVWFVCLYFIGAYLRLCCDIEKYAKYLRKHWLLTLLIIFFPSLWGLFSGCIKHLLGGATFLDTDFWAYNSILVFPASLVWFLLAFKMKINDSMNKPILMLGKTSFAVYLITDNRNMRFVLWDYVREYTSINTFNIIWQYVTTIIVLYVLCSIIDMVRQYLFSKVKLPAIVSNRIQIIDKWFNIC